MSPAFVDSHVHFWDPIGLPYPWLAEVPRIAQPHRPAELAAETGGAGPEQVVFVQAECERSRWLDEVVWVEGLAAAERRIGAIVAHAPMNQGATTAAALAELRRHPLVRGVRHLLQGESDPEFCLRDTFVEGVRRAGDAGLVFEICCRPVQLTAVVALVRLCPQCRFILDHAGKPDLRTGLIAAWRRAIAQLAELPNVACKLSGLVTEADAQTWTVETLRPVVDHLLATFGPSRLLFGSDWPVLKLAATYGRWLETARTLTEHLPGAGQAAIFSENARQLYRLNAYV